MANLRCYLLTFEVTLQYSLYVGEDKHSSPGICRSMEKLNHLMLSSRLSSPNEAPCLLMLLTWVPNVIVAQPKTIYLLAKQSAGEVTVESYRSFFVDEPIKLLIVVKE